MKFLGAGTFILYSIITGGIVGLFVWSFLAILSVTTRFLWVDLPNVIDISGISAHLYVQAEMAEGCLELGH